MTTDPQQPNDDADVERIADEFADLCADGQLPSIEDYVSRFPHLKEQLQSILPVILQMNHCGATASTPEEPMVRELGDFQLLREIGRGGMGVVYEAYQTSLGRRVALKVLPTTVISNDRNQLRFELESRSAAKLHHANIVPVYGVGEQDGLKYYVMQLIEGCGMDEIVREIRRRSDIPGDALTDAPLLRSERLSYVEAAATWLVSGADPVVIPQISSAEPCQTAQPEDLSAQAKSAPRPASGVSTASRGRGEYPRNIVRLGIRICDALHYAHGQGVFHRDVKPSNLMLDALGQIWVMDFGLAKADDSRDLTRTGDLVGTLRYMAPERFRGESDARSDVYSLGLTLYEMLLLRPAFDAADRAELIHQLTTKSPMRPRQAIPGFPRDLETVLLKSIEPQPSRRYASAGAVRDDLQRFLDGRSILARRASLMDRLFKWVGREPIVAGLTMSVLLVMAVAIIGISTLWRAAVVARTAAEHNLVDADRQRAEANRARTKAEQNEHAAQTSLRNAVEAVDAMLTSVAREDLNGVPRMDRVRRELLENALMILQQLLDENPASEMLRFETAKAYSRVSDICRLLGSYTEAEESSDRAIALLEQLTNGTTQPAPFQFQLAATLNRRAQLAVLLGDHAGAEARLRQAVALRSDPPSHVDHIRWSVALADDLTELATLLSGQRRYTEAEEKFLQATQLCDDLLEQDPDSIEIRNQLATTCSNSGTLQRRRGRSAETERLYERALELRRELAETAPGRPELTEELAISYNNLGFLFRLRRRTSTAITLYQKSLELREQLAQDYPDIPSYRKRLAFGCAVLARITGDTQEKERLLRRAFQFRLRLTEEFPRNPDHWHELTLAYGSLTRLLSKNSRSSETEDLADQLAEAHERYLNVIGERLTMSADLDDSPLLNADAELIESFIVRADELRQTDNAQRSLPLYTEASQIINHDLVASPNDLQLLATRAHLEASWSSALRDLGRFDDAVTHCDAAIRDLRFVTESEPDNESHWLKLASEWRRRAIVLADLSRSEDVEAALQQSAAARISLAARFPDNDDYQLELASVLRETARACEVTNNNSQALEKFNQATDVCRLLLAGTPSRRAFRRDLAEALRERGQLQCRILDVAAGLADLEEATMLTRQLVAEKSLYERQHCRTANDLAWQLLITREISRRDPERALILAREVVQIRPADDSYQNTLGVGLLRVGQFRESQRALEQAVLLGGGDALDFYALAIVMQNLEKRPDAIEYMNRAAAWTAAHDSTDEGLDVLRNEALAIIPSAEQQQSYHHD